MSANKDTMKGRIKQAAGDLTDNDRLKHEGKIDEAAGEVKDTAGKAIDWAKDKLTGAESDDQGR
jgi:uncharacterized protein YjbJ (UPF0337 family)